ncbi:hypothetical protein FHY55_01335 [Oceanicola sp. D3]|uniref:type II toxin-antitoxin system RelE/ParE family toxin n=1 Tax=Oceanicola sp. D3 TaxID=2587163 RepID=UPI00111FC9DA|nr:type II toxin-antitoxin system RelE/ParE family toxin [Oceanicola sp. D3]QDC07968.1 hypothetical protein FHY55_01335 [Oceanicola sp. D3]
MLLHSRIRHKGLKRLVAKGDQRGLNSGWVPRIKRILNALDVAVSPMELDMPGWRLHELKGERAGTFSVRVTGNWRVTFRWDDEGPYDVHLEDYHGS